MFSGSEDGTVKIWDMRAPGFVREFLSRAPVNTVVLHPNQGELISGKVSDPCNHPLRTHASILPQIVLSEMEFGCNAWSPEGSLVSRLN